MSWRRVLLLCLFDLKHSLLKTKGLLFLIPFSFYWISMFKLIQDGGAEFVLSQQGLVVSTLLLSPELSEVLFVNSPAVLSLCLLLGLTTTPFMIMLASNNQLASDAGHGSMRYLLTRCSRTELFISRFLSCTVLISIAFTIMLGYASYVSMDIDQFIFADTLHYAGKIFITLILYALPIVAFMSVFSAWFSSTLGSLLWGGVAFFILIVVRYWYVDDIPQLKYVLPNFFKNNLLVVNHPDFLLHLSYMLVYTLIFASIGWLIFRTRNL